MTLKRLLPLMSVLLLATAASAQNITYELVGVTFTDGGTATGTFVYNPTTNVYSSVNIRTTPGTNQPGATYHFVCGQDVPSCTVVAPNSTQVLNLTSTAADQTGMPGFAIFFTGVGVTAGLGTAPSFDISNSSASVGVGAEAFCSDATCSSPVLATARATLTGFVVALITTPTDSPYQVRYAANLNFGESWIDIINTGLNGVPLLGPGFGAPAGTGNICVNVYVLSSDEQLDGCCSCLVTPDQVVDLGVNRDLLGVKNTLTGATETSVTIKLIGSNAGATSCANSAASVTAANIVAGFTTFGATLHSTPVTGTYALAETPFLPAQFVTTGAAGANDELHSLVGRCAGIIGNGSGYGICASCKVGALGASKM